MGVGGNNHADRAGFDWLRSTSATSAVTPTASSTSQLAPHPPNHQPVHHLRRTAAVPRRVSHSQRRISCHQQLVCAALLWFDDNTVPSLVVIEQFSLLPRNRLEAWTEPTSDCEIGVTVSDHGM